MGALTTAIGSWRSKRVLSVSLVKVAAVRCIVLHPTAIVDKLSPGCLRLRSRPRQEAFTQAPRFTDLASCSSPHGVDFEGIVDRMEQNLQLEGTTFARENVTHDRNRAELGMQVVHACLGQKQNGDDSLSQQRT